ARQLHAAAREIAATSTSMPQTAVELRGLPGIGAYTAAAIASIAFGEVVPVLDGNVERVVSRLLASAEDPKKVAVRRRLATEAAELLDPHRPGDSNQALMELGATVCVPLRPRCDACPLAASCQGLASGRPESFPPARERKAPIRVRHRVAVVSEEERLLLYRRPDDAELLAGTWELPWAEVAGGEFLVSEAESLAASEAVLAERYGGVWRLETPCGTARHSITHRAITLEVWRACVQPSGTVSEGRLEPGFFRRQELGDLPLSSQVRKVLAKIEPS
ncbi:MAG: NUDIX domain-containing protein, partial [Acidobacteria bacterium]|nr:NUDIX domain-containing protein [Acidobacteriota bacterium]